MKRSRQQDRPNRAAPARPPRPGAGSTRATGALTRSRAALLAALVAVAFALLWWRIAPRPHAAEEIATRGLATEQMLDSLRACVGAKDWDRALLWARAANRSRPGTASLILNEGLQSHNYAQSGSGRWPGRSAARTSLDRMELEKRAAAMFDSAAAVARTDDEWANIQRWRGEQYEVLGLPLDALRAYDDALDRAPDFKPARARAEWLQRMFVRPADPASVSAMDAAPRH
jgi:hypothetical protein